MRISWSRQISAATTRFIVLIEHSRGVDASIFCSKELEKAGVSVDLGSAAAQAVGGRTFTIAGGVGVAGATGTNFNDVLTGSGLNNVLRGGAGNDSLVSQVLEQSFRVMLEVGWGAGHDAQDLGLCR